MNAYIRAMRLGRWPRSLAIFAGSAAFFFLNLDFFKSFSLLWVVSQFVLSFLLTWAISTANYVINEIADAPFDIHHPTKRHRPLVMGEIKKTPFLCVGIILAVVSLLIAFALFSRPFFLSLFALLLAGFIYNIKPVRTKDIPFLDSISESANNPIRFFIGWFVLSSSQGLPPVSLLLSWWAFGNFLMVAKRLSEFRFLKERAGDYRSPLRRYSKKSLFFGVISSVVVFFAAYFYFAACFKLQFFIYLSPFLFFYFFLIFRKTLREDEVMEEPERLLMHPLFAIYTLFLLLVFLIFLLI